MATLILVGGLLIFLLIGLPVAFALLLSSLALILIEGKLPLLILAQRLTNAKGGPVDPPSLRWPEPAF